MKANWENRTLFHGDNLQFLRGINSETIDLVATDPPFNKGRDFHATPDSLAKGASFQDRWSWEEDVHQDWVDQIKNDWPPLMEAIESARHAHSDGMGAFMCFLAVRLLAMHRILKPTGSIFLHCDPTASHYIKAVMDAIFGAKNFRADITWRRATAKGNATSNFACNTDTILYYAKDGKKHVYNPQYAPYNEEYVAKAYRHTEEGTGRRYRLSDLTAGTGNTNPNQTYELMGVTRTWACVREKMDQWIAEGRIVQTKPGAVPCYKRYLDEGEGTPIDNLWTDIGMLQGASKEHLGYPTQKPLALYERIIKTASNKGDVVLDPFAGCATTCVAAENLERQWLGMDLWKKAAQVIYERMQAASHHLDGGKIIITQAIPQRTDDGQMAAPYLKAKIKKIDPDEGPRMSNAEMKAKLVEEHGMVCQGCLREFDASDYLELDHEKPRSDGGANSINNRTLLCKPCNGLKSNDKTMSGLVKAIRAAANNSADPRHGWAKNAPVLSRKA